MRAPQPPRPQPPKPDTPKVAGELITVQIAMAAESMDCIRVKIIVPTKPRFVPNLNEAYYVPNLPATQGTVDLEGAYLMNEWRGTGEDLAYLMWGMVFETSEEAVEAVKKAVNTVFGGDVDAPYQE